MKTPEESADAHAAYYRQLVKRGVGSLEAIELTRTYVMATVMAAKSSPPEPWQQAV